MDAGLKKTRPRSWPLALLTFLLLVASVKAVGIEEVEEVYHPDYLRRNPIALHRNPNGPCDRSPTSRFQCPEGWSLEEDAEGAVCLWLSESQEEGQDEANQTCSSMGGRLLAIRSQARQDTVVEYLKDVDSTLWTGAYRHQINASLQGTYVWPEGDNVTYNNLPDGYELIYMLYPKSCIYLDKGNSRAWKETEHCSETRRFVCDQKPPCVPGWMGDHCDLECRCAGEPCQGGQLCSGGCQAGWSGRSCCQRKEAAEVAYYCINRAGSRRMELRVDPRGTTYEALLLVDASGEEQSWCQQISLVHDRRDFSYLIHVPMYEEGSRLNVQGPCGREEVGNNTYMWRLSLQEKRGFRLPYDRNVVVTCDFNDAEALSRGTGYSVQREQENERASKAMEHLDPVREDVVLEVLDASTGHVIHQAELGKAVILRMRLNVSGGVTARGVSPYMCKASGPEGVAEQLLTDYRGCPSARGVVSSLRGHNGTLTTRPFALFALPEQSSLTITCQFTFCFTESEQPECDDRCASMGGNGRKKRALRAKPKSAYTTIRIVRGSQYTPPPDSEVSSGGHLSASTWVTMVTWLLWDILLVQSDQLF